MSAFRLIGSSSSSRSQSPPHTAYVHATVPFVSSPSQTHHSFGYEVRGMTETYVVRCSYMDLDTIETALNKCPFFTTLYRRNVRAMLMWRHADRVWVPDNFPCNLMHDSDIIILKRAATPQPEYPVRHIRAPNQVFVVQIRLTCVTPGCLLVVMDPTKTIRESLKDDGRFSSQVLEGRSTLLRKGNTLIPVDQLGQALERDAKYAIRLKLPGCVWRTSTLRSFLKCVLN